MYKTTWYCRWCGAITPKGRSERDGFCPGGKCKQAWWRANKKYRANVTPLKDQKSPRCSNGNAKRPRKRGMIKSKVG